MWVWSGSSELGLPREVSPARARAASFGSREIALAKQRKPRAHVGGSVTSRWADFLPTEVSPCEGGIFGINWSQGCP